MYSEEKIASLWIDRLGLSHPIDVEAIIRQFATVSNERLPVRADAILYRSKNLAEKPVVFVQVGLSEVRRTFTLAHELGHLFIPWHVGSFVCKPDPSIGADALAEYHFAELEREANRFAARFLIPDSYAADLFQRLDDPALMLKETSKSKISNLAASFRFLNCLPDGFLMVEVDETGDVVRSNRTKGTVFKVPELGEQWDETVFTMLGGKVSQTKISTGVIYWVDVRKVRLSPESVPDQASSEIIDEIIDDLGLRPSRIKLLQTINGIIGAANSVVKHTTSGDLYTMVNIRFQGRPELHGIVSHKRFRGFLAAKAAEINARSRR